MIHFRDSRISAPWARLAALIACVVLAAPVGPAVPLVAAGPADPVFRAVGWYSSNWAGYTTRTGTFTNVAGQWAVPSVSTSPGGISAVWLGIGGISEQELIQVGTLQSASGGRASYSAWWEILPAPAVVIHTFTVRPGDHITASIQQVAGSTWRISISDAGHGSFTTTRQFGGDGTSAEWIMEAPVIGRRIGPLAHFSLLTFNHLTANGKNPRLSASLAGVMIQGGVRVATPSSPDKERDGFAIRRSSTAPPAP